MPASVAARAPKGGADQFPAMTSHPYHPYWIVDIH
jgi:hypothetical protein